MATGIPEQVKDAVTFIFIKDDSGRMIPNGTAFFVGVKNEHDPNAMNVYLISARHVIWDKEKKSFFESIYLRINKKSGGSELIQIPLRGPRPSKVFGHEDPNVDIAVIPFLPDPNIFEFKCIPEKMITTEEMFKELKIREGHEVFFIGLFTHYYGDQKNYPLARFGRVALITDEKIPWHDDVNQPPKMLDLYLLETQSFAGNSGAPVFFYLGATREPGVLILGGPKLLLAGVMKGSFLDAKKIQVAETRRIPLSFENIGIAAVIPAYKLHQILFCKELKESRSIEIKPRPPSK